MKRRVSSRLLEWEAIAGLVLVLAVVVNFCAARVFAQMPPLTCTEVQARVTRVVDGDTFDATVSLGYDVMVTGRFRVLGVDTPERNQPGYTEAKVAVEQLLTGQPIGITACRKDSFGRWLADVKVPGAGDLRQWLLDRKLGIPFRR